MIARITTLFLLLSLAVNGQVIFSGQILDQEDNPVSRASITLSRTADGSIVAYTNSNINGYFEIKSPIESDSIYILINHISFQSQSIRIKNEAQELQITLEDRTELLEDILITSPVIKKGDTLSYQVDAFQKFDDFSLADVMKRIPGLDVDNRGNVFYQGNPIEKFYIEGLDMMGEAYGVINNNIPADRVNRVEVLENHQSIKVLDDVSMSDRTSINIKLKQKYTAIAPINLGIGGKEFLYQLNTSPMIFSPQNQFFTNISANNSGKRAGNINQQAVNTGISMVPVENNQLVDVRNPGTPQFTENRWRNNQSLFGSVNYLKRIRARYDFNVNISGLLDKEKRAGNNFSEISLPGGDNYIVDEKINSTIFQKPVSIKIGLNENSTKNYFKNTAQYTYESNHSEGTVIRNGDEIIQLAKIPLQRLSNIFSLIRNYNGRLLNIESNLDLRNYPQQLTISPGQIGFGLDFNELVQKVNKQTVLANLSVGTYKVYKGYTFRGKFKGQFDNQGFDTEMRDKFEFQMLDSNYTNRLRFNKHFLSFENSIERKKNSWEFRFEVPVKYLYLGINDTIHSVERKNIKFLVEPGYQIRYKYKNYLRLFNSGSFNQSFGDLNSLNFGYYMSDYLNMTIKDTPLSEIKTLRNSLGITYQNPFKRLSASVNAGASFSRNNLITQRQMNENGSVVISGFLKDNDSKNQSLRGSINYNFPGDKLQLKYSGDLFFSQRQIEDNTVDMMMKSSIFNNSAQLSFYPTEFLSFSGDFKIQSYVNQYSSNQKMSSQNNSLKLSAKYLLNEKHILTFEAEDFKTAGIKDHYWFVDLKYRLNNGPRKIGFELAANNILNRNQFAYTSLGVAEFSQKLFQLRPFELMATMRWVISPRSKNR